MSDFQLRKASRVGFRPLVGLFSKSGGGKTYSALLLARGFVGLPGRIAIIDTEEGRGEMYAPVPGETPLPIGDYEVVPMGAPFPPSKYVEAIEFVESQGVDIGIVDSLSHCWEGIGGVLEQASENEARSGKAGLHNWNRPKMEFAKLVAKLLRSKIPWIVCLRAKEKSRQVKDDRGKTVIQKDEVITPITESNFVFEMSAYGEFDQDHNFHPLKPMPASLAACFPKGSPITVEHGAKLARWCAAPSAVAPGPAVLTKGADGPKPPTLRQLKGKLWSITQPIHQSEDGDTADLRKAAMDRLQQWLWDEGIIADSEVLSEIQADRLVEVVGNVEEKLKGAE